MGATSRETQFQVLGAVAALCAGTPIELGRRQERCLLGLLLLEADRPVAAERLVDLLWHDDATDRARATLHTYVARLRGRLAPYDVKIVTGAHGYQLCVDAQTVDIHRFVAAVDAAPSIEDAAARADALASALAMWRGPLLAGAADDLLRARLSPVFEEKRMVAQERRIEAVLATADAADVVPELAELVHHARGRERLVELYLLALYRSGRRGEALEVYRRTRQQFVDDLGLEPGPTLQDLHRRILADSPDLQPDQPTQRSPVVARFLPRDIAGFIGREGELDQLDRLLDDHASGVIALSAIHGGAGVGKTALAVRWAHRVAAQFPDGQLYVNLRGLGAAAAQPIDALGQLLRGLGVEPDRIPYGADEAAALYRSTAAGRRVLVLLDNAHSSEQVRPLLTGGPPAMTLVTSRLRLDGLLALDRAATLLIDLLPPADARQLLIDTIGPTRAAEAGEANLDGLAALCGYLPLALRIAAARVVVAPDFPVADLIAELTEARLSGLEVEAGTIAVRRAFDASYRTLSDTAARVFCALGTVSHTSLLPAAVAVLADLDVDTTQRALEDLARRHLVQAGAGGRIDMHDLMRVYAAEQARGRVAATELATGIERLADWYVQHGVAAQSVFDPYRRTVDMRLTYPAEAEVSFADSEAAMAWFDAESANIIALGRNAAEHHLARATWQLADCQYSYLVRTHALATLRESHVSGVDAARADGRLDGERLMANGLGVAHALARDFDEAIVWMERAAATAAELGVEREAITSRLNIASVYGHKGDRTESERHMRKALPGTRALGEPYLLCVLLSNLGWVCTEDGRPAEALVLLEEALQLAVDHGIEQQLPPLQVHLAHALVDLARFDEARPFAEAAAANAVGDHLSTGRALYWLGRAARGQGALDMAVAHWRRAEEILERIGSLDVEFPRAALASVTVRD